jgi:hypothetical protein
MRAKEITEIDLHTSAALAHNPRQGNGHFSPDSQQRLAIPKSVATEALAPAGAALAAFAFATQLVWDISATNVAQSADDMGGDSDKQISEPGTNALAQGM